LDPGKTRLSFVTEYGTFHLVKESPSLLKEGGNLVPLALADGVPNANRDQQESFRDNQIG